MKRHTILFDINETVLNLNLLKPKFKHVFRDENVLALWFSSLLHSSTVCALSGVKSEFSTLAADMLNTIAARKNIKLTVQDRDDILSTFANLPAHNDIKPALNTLRNAGYQTVAFSNSSQALIEKQISNAELNDYFDQIISVESTGSFKPDPKVYEFVAQKLNTPLSSLRLVATHDWDTHGAMSTGMLSAYIQRDNIPYHPQYLKPSIIENNMFDIVNKIIQEDRES